MRVAKEEGQGDGSWTLLGQNNGRIADLPENTPKGLCVHPFAEQPSIFEGDAPKSLLLFRHQEVE
jgi:hypothetical protein